MAGTWDHGLPSKRDGLSLVQCPSMGRGATAAGAAQRAHAASARIAPPPQGEAAQWRTSVLHAQARSRSGPAAGTWERGHPPKKSGLPLVQCPSVGYGATTAGAAQRARGKRPYCASSPKRGNAVAQRYATCTSRLTMGKLQPARGTTALHRRTAASRSCSALLKGVRTPQPPQRSAHARRAPVLRLLPRDSQRCGAQARCIRKPAHEVNAKAGTWEHGLAPKTGGLSLVQCPSIGRKATTAGAAQYACAVSARVALLPQREAAQWRTRALHAQAGS